MCSRAWKRGPEINRRRGDFPMPTKYLTDQNVDKPKHRRTETTTPQFSTLYATVYCRIFVSMIRGMYCIYIRTCILLVRCTVDINTHNCKILVVYSIQKCQQKWGFCWVESRKSFWKWNTAFKTDNKHKCVHINRIDLWVTGQNDHKPKRPQTGSAANWNCHRSERPQTWTATDRKATSQNGHTTWYPDRLQGVCMTSGQQNTHFKTSCWMDVFS